MRKLEKVAFLLCCLALLCVMGVGAWSVIDKGDAFDDYKDARPAFGYLRYETLSFAPTEKKDAAGFKAAQEKAAPVLEDVRTAVSYTGTQASQCPVDTRLQSLCYGNAVRDSSYTLADSEVTFVAYRELLGKGYLWVTVDQSVTNAAGETQIVWDGALCLVEVKPADDGTFTVTDMVIAELAEKE